MVQRPPQSLNRELTPPPKRRFSTNCFFRCSKLLSATTKTEEKKDITGAK
jgi:hypothetical protein